MSTIYFDANKNAYAFEIENPICIINDEIWAKYAATDKWDIIDGVFTDISNTETYKEQQAQQEAERIAMLKLTAADVERAIYKAKGIDFEDVIAQLEAMPLTEGQSPVVDIKALKIELKANNFYRGNPYIDIVGTLLGFSKEQLDEFFETNDYTKLLTPVVTEPDSGTDDTETNSAGETTEDETATVSGTDGAATAEDEE